MTKETTTPRQSSDPSEQMTSVLDSCASGPVLIQRPGSFDVIVMTTEAYADLIDRIQTVEVIDDVAADPLLSDLAAEFGPRADTKE
jgi:hypothetical protein